MLFRIAILLGFAIIGIKASHFRGSFITWTVDKTDPYYFPANYYASVAKVHIKFGASWRRSDGQSYCTNSSIDTCQLFHHGSWSVYYGYSQTYTPYFHSSFTAGFFCEKFSIDGDFVVGSNTVTIFLPKNYFYKIQTSSCCWVGYLNRYSSSSWHVQILPSLQPRPGGSITNLNTPPQIEYLPVFQHRLKYYNYYNQLVVNYALPVSDPDNDMVKCRWAANFTEGGGIWNARLGQLHEHNCSLSLSDYQYAYTLGWYAFAVMVEDFAYDYSLGRYVRLTSMPLQFTVEINDKSSMVHCSQNYMRIELDKTYYNASLYSSITLRSASCPAWYSSTHIMLGTVPGSCGSTRKDTANHIVYENEVVLTAKSTGNQLITRNLYQKIYFSCSYGRNGFVSNVGFQPVTSINVTEGKSHTNKQMISTTSIVVICCGALLAIVIVGLALKIRKMHRQNKVVSSVASYQMEDPYKQTPEDQKVKEMVKEDLHAVCVMSPAMQAAIF
eukprot:gene14934-16474_t